MTPEIEEKMKAAWKAYYGNDIQQTCKLLLEVGNACETQHLPLPKDLEELTALCMLQDSLELLADKLEKDKPKP